MAGTNPVDPLEEARRLVNEAGPRAAELIERALANPDFDKLSKRMRAKLEKSLAGYRSRTDQSG